MKLVSEDVVEFRRVNKNVKDGGKVNFYYTFEDDKSSFQLFSRSELNLEKGDNVQLVFNTRNWNGQVYFDLVDAYKAD